MRNTQVAKSELPDGKYQGKIIGMEDVTINGRAVLRITGQVESDDPTLHGTRVSTLAGPTLAPTSRLGRFFVAATGRRLTPGEEVDLDDMLDKPVILVVENQTSKNGDDAVYPRIKDVEPTNEG